MLNVKCATTARLRAMDESHQELNLDRKYAQEIELGELMSVADFEVSVH
jgi:hypothetical protein